MHAGLVRIGRWVVGVGLATVVVLAHAQRLYVPSGGFPHATMSRAIYGGGARFDGLRGNFGGEGLRGYPMHAEPPVRYGPPYGRYEGAPSGYRIGIGRFDGRYRESGLAQVSAEARPMPHPPADSPVRAGSIREDVARYNEERATFRPFARGNGDGPRPPMPSPYRN